VPNAIVACGQPFPIDARVVRWFEPPYWSAYAVGPRFEAEGPHGLRYTPARRLAEHGPATLADLCAKIDLLVLHYDACGSSRECFRVLQDVRGLSVHFLLDVDGTLYQTLDLVDQAWHARSANPRSIGVEIAHVGARASQGEEPGLVRGTVHGDLLEQAPFTRAQEEVLARLAAALAAALPQIELDAPRGPDGTVRREALAPDELASFHGVIGHYHVTRDKIDPGPALDWERLLARARALRYPAAP
jgi:N-acetyl-anhydromuramyl-L-alanine amidase AmpD